MPKSLRVNKKQIGYVKLALLRRGYSSQQMLAEDLNLCRTTVNRFLNGYPVLVINFYELCHHLNLSWEEVADLEVFDLN
jgi:biotin operon repressor